ncbi:MAG: hypothetical protein Q7R69_02920 [bacterium]|nr:hypothetical protein [bacterium]
MPALDLIFIISFAVSGLAVVLLIAAKKFGEKQKKPFFLLSIISRGDIRVRAIYHKVVHLYSEGKEKTSFLFHKQIPIHSRNSFNKLLVYLGEKREQYANNMRDSRLLKKSDGISEFFKNISDIEKGNGEIHDVCEDGSQDDKKEVR